MENIITLKGKRFDLDKVAPIDQKEFIDMCEAKGTFEWNFCKWKKRINIIAGYDYCKTKEEVKKLIEGVKNDRIY